MNFATLNGINLHYRSDGEPHGTPFVLMHSLGTDLRLWDDLIPRLDPTLHLIRFDLRGGAAFYALRGGRLGALRDHGECDLPRPVYD